MPNLADDATIASLIEDLQISLLVDEIKREGYAVEFVKWCEDAETPGALGYLAGVTLRHRKAVKVSTHRRTRAMVVAILSHELEHVRGKDSATNHPELGLVCGGCMAPRPPS